MPPWGHSPAVRVLRVSILLSALVAGLLAAASPWLLARLPEPVAEPEADMPVKIAYVELAASPRLGL